MSQYLAVFLPYRKGPMSERTTPPKGTRSPVTHSSRWVGWWLLACLTLAAGWTFSACGDDENGAEPGPPTSTGTNPSSGGNSSGGGGSGGTGAAAGGNGPGPGGAAGATAGGGQGGGPCHGTPAAANRVRKVVVSHPWDASSNETDVFEVLELSEAGALSQTGHSFQLGFASTGTIAFTPDGEIGLAVVVDGTVGKLGVFRFDGTGQPQVVHAMFGGPFNAYEVIMDPSGSRAYVLDNQWRQWGGGVYAVSIACDGTLSDEGMLFAAKLPAALALLPDDPDHAVLAAVDAFSSPTDLDAHLLSWSATPSWVTGIDVFPDEDAIVASAAVTADGRYVLIGDNTMLLGANTRVGVVEVTGGTIVAKQVLAPLEDPFSIVTSPYNDRAIVVSGFGNAIFELSYDAANSTTPFTIVGELNYSGSNPSLPNKAVMVDRGDLTGLVLVAENQGVRRVEFKGGGQIQDHGLTSFGQGTEYIVGAIGVQP